MGLHNVQCLIQVDDIIPILSSAVYILCVVLKDLLDGITFDGCAKSIQLVLSSKVTIIGITSSTCVHCTPFCAMTLLFSTIPISLSKNFYFLVCFLVLLHTCMYSHQVYIVLGWLLL